VIGAVAGGIWIPQYLGLAFADALSSLGLVVGLFFGLFGSRIAASSGRVNVGIVIPSRVAFHRELRRALNDSLSGLPVVILDEYEDKKSVMEDLADFVPCLLRTYRAKPDYLVICAPRASQGNSADLVRVVRDLTRRGGAAFFIEGLPLAELTDRERRRTSTVTSDSQAGAEILAAHVARTSKPLDEILVLAGPSDSAPARVRVDLLGSLLPNGHVMTGDSAGWTRLAARQAVLDACAGGKRYNTIVAGNDTMAFGCVDALRSQGERGRKVRVFGYDGVLRALVAISEPMSPLVGTIRIPPSAYGDQIGYMIVEEVTHHTLRRRSLSDVMISIDGSHLITSSNVDLILED
jgi:ABC-type sugar transport system substrate-binding protein